MLRTHSFKYCSVSGVAREGRGWWQHSLLDGLLISLIHVRLSHCERYTFTFILVRRHVGSQAGVAWCAAWPFGQLVAIGSYRFDSKTN